jgi:hypothetical protein
MHARALRELATAREGFMRAVALVALAVSAGGVLYAGSSLPALSQSQAELRERVTNCQTFYKKMNPRGAAWTPQSPAAYWRQRCWYPVEADNGAIYFINLGLVERFPPGAVAQIFYEDNQLPQRWFFDCAGHFSVEGDRSTSPMIHAPSRSVAAHISNIVCAGAGIVAGTKDTSSAPLSVHAQSKSLITKAFTDCLLSQGQNGSYTSFDGGRSAIRLMGQACKAQWDAWQDQCIAKGGTDGGPGGCTMQAGLLAQTALKLLGK